MAQVAAELVCKLAAPDALPARAVACLHAQRVFEGFRTTGPESPDCSLVTAVIAHR